MNLQTLLMKEKSMAHPRTEKGSSLKDIILTEKDCLGVYITMSLRRFYIGLD